MKEQDYYSSDAVHFSVLFGRGMYKLLDEQVECPLRVANSERALSPVLYNLLSEERFFAKRTVANSAFERCLRTQILHAPPREVILWPCDMIGVNLADIASYEILAHNYYTDMPISHDKVRGNKALLFPYDGVASPKSLQDVLGTFEEHSWKNEKMRRLAVEIARAFDRLNAYEYIYLDVHPSRLYENDNGSIMFDYSDLVFAARDLYGDHPEEIFAPEAQRYPLEFCDPAYAQGKIGMLDYNSQNYSLAALLFYLLYDRYAYEGKLALGLSDDTLQQHYTKMRALYRMPVFLFDPNDTRNALGVFAEDEQVLDLWRTSPEPLQEIFLRVLCEGNAMRQHPVSNPTPHDWLEVFKEIGWLDADLRSGEVAA